MRIEPPEDGLLCVLERADSSPCLLARLPTNTIGSHRGSGDYMHSRCSIVLRGSKASSTHVTLAEQTTKRQICLDFAEQLSKSLQ